MTYVKNPSVKSLIPISKKPGMRRREKWFEVVRHFYQSKKTLQHYCEEKEIREHSLKYWRTQYNKEQHQFISVTCEDKSENEQIITVQEDPPRHRTLCTLELGNNRRLIIESPEALNLVNTILRAVVSSDVPRT